MEPEAQRLHDLRRLAESHAAAPPHRHAIAVGGQLARLAPVGQPALEDAHRLMPLSVADRSISAIS